MLSFDVMARALVSGIYNRHLLEVLQWGGRTRAGEIARLDEQQPPGDPVGTSCQDARRGRRNAGLPHGADVRAWGELEYIQRRKPWQVIERRPRFYGIPPGAPPPERAS